MYKKEDGAEETRSLECRLTREEVEHRAADLVLILRDKGIKEQSKKDHASEAKKKIDKLDLEIAVLGEQVRSKSEYRGVRCRWVRDDPTRTIELHRLDTGEVIHTRKLSDSEMQRSLFEVVKDEVSAENEPEQPVEQVDDKRGLPPGSELKSVELIVNPADAQTPAPAPAEEEEVAPPPSLLTDDGDAVGF